MTITKVVSGVSMDASLPIHVAMRSSSENAKTSERRSAWFWTAFIVGLFGINIAIAAIAIVLASSDPSFRPMPGYGELAVDWQERKDLLQSSAELGWDVDIHPIASDKVAISVRDRNGLPVSGYAGTIKLYHFAQVHKRQTASIHEVADKPGEYLADVDVRSLGRWQVEMTLLKQAQPTYLFDRSLDWFPEKSSNVDAGAK